MQKDIGLKEIFYFIKTTLRPYYKYVFVMFFSGIVWAIDLSLRPYLFKIILNIVAETPPESIVEAVFFPILYYLGILSLLSFSYRLYDFFIEVHMMPEWAARIIETAFSGVIHNNYTFFQKTLSGSIGAKINDLAESVPNLFQILIDKFITRIFGISLVLITLHKVSGIFSLMTALWVFIFIILSFIAGVKGRELSNKRFMQSAFMTGSMVDVFSNISTVWFFSASNYEITRFKNGIQKIVAFAKELELLRFFFWLFFGVSFITLQGLSLYFLVLQRAKNLITVGDFSLVLTLNLSLANFVWDLARDFSQFAKHLGRITQSLSMLYESSEIIDSSDANSLVITGGTIKFEDVDFYFRGEAPLFQHKTVTIPAGQKVGLVGSSGSGKTTFVNLILRLYDVKSGKILIDDQDIRSVTLQSLRDSIIVVQQESALFHRSIKENIAYGISHITIENVIEAAKKAQIHDMIIRLPHGYDTVIGEEGFKPSGGERQRFNIARGHMKKNAKIVILDEITSQLDLKNEASILQNLRDLIEGKTTIIIAHRLSTLLYVDRILVFHQGKIVEDGTHEELLAKNGFYKSLWDMQRETFLLHASDE
jgi:ATP-binding cassette subfamily B protein